MKIDMIKVPVRELIKAYLESIQENIRRLKEKKWK